MKNRVMVVDDAAFMRMVLKDLLGKNGFEVIAEAENGISALNKYKEVQPDIVMMDITMPVMDGLDALKQIKAFDSNATVVMCSAMGQKNMVIEAIKNGASDFIVKPFENDKVIEILKKLAQNKGEL